jgi:hypothetical protein
MIRVIFLLTIALLLMSGPCFFEQSGSRTTATESRANFEFGATGVIDAREVDILGRLGPLDFFKTLLKTDSEQGIRFIQEDVEIRSFPNPLLIDIVITGPERRGKGSMTTLSDDLMRGLKFRADWKKGMETRPVISISVKEILGPQHSRLMKSDTWKYSLLVEAPDVPLDNHLILKISAPDGRSVATVSARL